MPGGKKIEKSKQPAEKYESQFSKYKIGPEGKNIESSVLETEPRPNSLIQ